MKKILTIIILLACVLIGYHILHTKSTDDIVMSNMNHQANLEEVKDALSQHLKTENVNQFIQGVIDYNTTINHTTLNNGFKPFKQPQYDMAKITELWSAKKGNFIGTNCRINTFMLLKDNIKIKQSSFDDKLLFFDKEAIEDGHIFNKIDTDNFKQLFSQVKTDNTTDTAVHAEKMKQHFANVKFDDKVKMLSVVLHDNLDGDYLFIGHVGVLVEDQGKYLFVEKLSFEEPFQAIKFNTKEECYKYLSHKYKDYTTEETAAPFIMENDQWIKM